MSVPEIRAEELKQRLESGENLFLLDVRDEFEFVVLSHSSSEQKQRKTGAVWPGLSGYDSRQGPVQKFHGRMA